MLLTLLARLPAVRLHDSTECSTFFSDLLKHYPAIDLIAAKLDGEIYCRGVQPWHVSSVADRLWFKRMLETRDFVMGEYRIGRTSKKAVISFGYPILDNAGRVLGVVATGVDLFRLSKTMANTNLPSESIVTIFDGPGTILARVPDPQQWVGKSGADTSLFRAMTARQGEGTAEIRGRDGRIYLAGFTNLHGLPQGQDVYVSMVVPQGVLFDTSLVRNLVGLGVLGALGFAGAWLQIRRSILRPVGTLMNATRRLAAGDLSQRVEAGSLVEIDALATAFNTLADRLAAQTRERTLLNEMGDLLQVCDTVKDACAVVPRLAAQLFPATSGAVFLFHPSRDLVECAAAWGTAAAECDGALFPPGECWALQGGQVHVVQDTATGIVCGHLSKPLPTAYLCLPLMAQGDMLGIVHLNDRAPDSGARSVLVNEHSTNLAKALAEQVALAVANLRLRETLRSQSIRDPLTGLFNRRYLEETLEREIRRAERNRHPMGILMFDIDRFKEFNDTFGHDAGDAVLREVGVLLRTRFRAEDIACRYGGEEFVVILPEAFLDDTRARAEELREAAKHLHVSPRGGALGSVTLSVRVAVFPDHGATGGVLLQAADAALYCAKQNGRDRIEAARS